MYRTWQGCAHALPSCLCRTAAVAVCLPTYLQGLHARERSVCKCWECTCMGAAALCLCLWCAILLSGLQFSWFGAESAAVAVMRLAYCEGINACCLRPGKQEQYCADGSLKRNAHSVTNQAPVPPAAQHINLHGMKQAQHDEKSITNPAVCRRPCASWEAAGAAARYRLRLHRLLPPHTRSRLQVHLRPPATLVVQQHTTPCLPCRPGRGRPAPLWRRGPRPALSSPDAARSGAAGSRGSRIGRRGVGRQVPPVAGRVLGAALLQTL